MQKWGNSCGVRIPNVILKTLDIKVNDRLDIKEENGNIVISKIKNNKWAIAERVEEYNGDKLENDFEWDDPKRREIW